MESRTCRGRSCVVPGPGARSSHVHPAQCQQLALPHAGHRRREVQHSLDHAQRVVRARLVEVEAIEVDRRRLRDPQLGRDRLPRHPLAVAQATHPPRSLRRPCLPAAARTGGRGEQRIELGLIEEADVLILVDGLGLLDRLARVRDDPALAQREVEDAVQEAEIVACALDRLALSKQTTMNSSMSSFVMFAIGFSPKNGATWTRR